MKTIIVLLSIIALTFIGLAQPTPPPICLVTVDHFSTHNMIVWEQSNTTGLDSIRVFRDDGGVPVLIGSQHVSDSSIYRDFSWNPNNGPATYQIAGVHSGNTQTALSAAHTTMHLTVTDNLTGGVECSWTFYNGNTVLNYECWRDTLLNDDWASIFNTTNTGQSSWNDNAMPSTSQLDYKLTTDFGFTCTYSRANDLNSSRSNRASMANPAVNVNEISGISIKLFPNPVVNELNITGTISNGQLEVVSIYDIQGRLVEDVSFNDSKTLSTAHNIEHLESGKYILEIRTNKAVKLISFVKE